ncbi:glutathione peroxidase [Flammeovirga kamogawensis]|uniref:Glutathione peroxidase n=1 Tax=Flammeovirga kamogawensis TaxID=373891 RepID=A0ABX8GXB0_9BACT|nr:glutathione peroxidase [Flammeovirga kamogawensis]MBB6460875.1 glutathione peroxidase [Flammeovirga kamogawensis]QWG08221.1 glutathione peroxidase [Flammeovirga kamogawensis]TRX70024.1 glutathione peroxidase [Flammeovirga kamogawensis]
MSAQFYSYTANTSAGNEVSMDDFEGKVILVVNTATQCGLTPQFKGLEELYIKYKDKGFVILGFPCNQFANQEPLSNEEMASTCELNFGVTFPLFQKVDVNGSNAHPIFKYLKDALPGTLFNGIKWNFTKFLIGKDGKPLERFAPTTTPDKIEKDIIKALA